MDRLGEHVRDGDRWWWLALIMGVIFAAASVVLAHIFVQTTPTDDPFITSADFWQPLGLLVLVGLGGGVVFALLAFSGRRNHLRRLAALRGDESAIPLAALRIDPALAPDVAEQPLELQWRVSAVTKLMQIPLQGLADVAVLVSVAAILFVLVAPFFVSPQFSGKNLVIYHAPQPMSVPEIVLRVVLTGVVLAITVALGVVYARIIPLYFGRPFGVTATSSGIDARTAFGSRIHMAWNEMRLLELGGASIRRRFILYAPGKCIEWTDYSANYAMDLGARYVPAGATASEQTLRQAKLLSLISVHTGLAPRTLTKSMQRDPAQAAGAQRRSIVVVFFVCVLIMAGITAADVAFPVTPYRWMNWASAGSLALTTLVLVVFGAWLAKTNRRLPEQAIPPSASAPPLDGSGITYTMGWKSPLLRRLVGIGLGVCLVVNLIPGLWVLVPALFGSRLQSISEDASPSIGTFILAGTLALFGVMGAGLAYGAATTGTLRIQADTDGLTIDIGRRREVILWSSIQDISWGAGRTSQFAYLVKGDVPTAMISWPAGLLAASTNTPRDGTVPIGPDALAALVAARTGLVLRVRTGV